MVLGRPTCHGRCTGFCVQEGKAIATDPTSQWYRKIDRMVHACAVKPGKKTCLGGRAVCLAAKTRKKTADASGPLRRYQETFDRYRSLRKQVLTLQKNQQEHKARIEMLEFQMAEIESAALKSGEDVALHQERDRLLNHKLIADTLTNAYTMLDNEDISSLTNVRSAMNDLESIEDYDPAYKKLSGSLSETYYVLEDVSKRLEDILDGLDFDGFKVIHS